MVLFLTGCDKMKNSINLKPKIVDEISFKANDFISVNPAYTRLIESDSGNYLFAYNHISTRFQFLNFKTGDITFEIGWPEEGPNSIQRFSGATLMGLDSIWLLTARPPALNLMNFSGEVVKKTEIKNTLRPIPVNYLFANSQAALYQCGATIFGPQPLLEGHHEISKEDLKKYQLVYSFDFENDLLQWHDVFYAEDYWDKGKKLSDYSWTRKDNQLYIAPFFDHEIQVFDMETGTITAKKEIKSKHINRFNYVNEIPWGENEGLKNDFAHDKYGTLLYDKYRDVFYRIFIPAYELEEEYDAKKLWAMFRSRPHTGIMVLDGELNVLAEHIFEKFEIHTSSNMFVGEKGLYLSLNNENHPDFDEDHFRYMVVRFE